VTKVKLVEVTELVATDIPSIVTDVLAGSKLVPDTVTVVPPAAAPEVGEMELMVGRADAKVTDESPAAISSALNT
jgi:hypothetical protein